MTHGNFRYTWIHILYIKYSGAMWSGSRYSDTRQSKHAARIADERRAKSAR